MNCAERRERLYDRLYGLLDEVTSAALDHHLSSCADCRREMDLLRGRDQVLDAWTPEYRSKRPLRMALPARRAGGLLWSAAAALVALATTLLFPVPAAYELVDQKATASLAPGSRIRTDAGATVRLGRAGRMELENGADLLYREGGPDRDHVLELNAGTVHVEVFATGRAFRIVVGDRNVEVRGTRFTVHRFSGEDLSPVLGEESMKHWNLASASVALLTVTSGTVVLSGPDGKRPVEAGRSVLATPAGVENVVAGESLAAVRKYRDELLRALAASQEKHRVLEGEVQALRAKHRKGELPSGATLESLLAGLQAAQAKGVPEEIQVAVALLGLLLEKDAAAFGGVLKAISSARNAGFAELLSSALWQDGGERLRAHRSDLLKLFLAPEMAGDIRAAVVQSLYSVFYGAAGVSDDEAAQLLRATQLFTGAGEDALTIRRFFAVISVRQLSANSAAWAEFQRFLGAESDEGIRRTALQSYFSGASRRKESAAPEGLLLDTLRGRYGSAAAQDQMRDPLLHWFTPENAGAFATSLRQAAGQFSEPSARQVVAGQLGLLHLIQRAPSALEALQQLEAAESDASARARMAEVLQAAEKGTLDLDKLMEKLQLNWNF